MRGPPQARVERIEDTLAGFYRPGVPSRCAPVHVKNRAALYTSTLTPCLSYLRPRFCGSAPRIQIRRPHLPGVTSV